MCKRVIFFFFFLGGRGAWLITIALLLSLYKQTLCLLCFVSEAYEPATLPDIADFSPLVTDPPPSFLDILAPLFPLQTNQVFHRSFA